jgi:hypothetical protein
MELIALRSLAGGRQSGPNGIQSVLNGGTF